VPNQAFRMGTTTWAFQCHFEVTPHIVDIWNRRELIGNPEKNQDDVNRMIQQTQQDFEQYQQAQTLFARTLMNRWLDQVEAG
jgi:GMP synthase (glutamine-hydrolysing)